MFTSEKFGELKIEGYILEKEASADLDGVHQMHLGSEPIKPLVFGLSH